MSPDLSEVTELKEEVGKIQRDTDKAAGALEESMKRLMEEHNCSSIEEAEELLEKLQGQETTAKAEFNRTHKEFMEKWGKVLEGGRDT